MKEKVCALGLMFLMAFCVFLAPASAIPAFTPYTIYGTVYVNNIATAGLTVSIEDTRTSETLTVTSDSEGYYQEDLMNLPSNWQDGDTIRVTGTIGGHTDTSTVIIYSGNASSEVNLYLSTSGGGGGGSDLISINMNVQDVSNNTPLVGASVRMFSDENDQTVYTDSSGMVNIYASPGANTLEISMSGYQTLTRTITDGSALANQLNTYKLTPTAPASAANPFATPGFEAMFMLLALAGAGLVLTYRR